MSGNYAILLPEILLSVAALIVMVVAPSVETSRQGRLVWVPLLAIGGGVIVSLSRWGGEAGGYFDMALEDNLAQFARILLFSAAGTVLVMASSYLREQDLPAAEFYVLVLLSAAGMGLLVTSADLVMTFLGIEVLSISSYVLAGYRHDGKSAEAAWKYFILGAFASAFLLYGIALFYGISGSTKYAVLSRVLGGMELSIVTGIALVLLLAGFAFKTALVPFHIWTPDVYEGAPVPISAYLAVASKAAAFIAFARVLGEVLPVLDVQWQGLLWISAALTMLVGNIAALTQSNVKRMLAYSSIAHAGYLLVGLTANNPMGGAALLFYLTSYAIMTLGAFTVVQLMARKSERFVNLLDYSGLGQESPFLAVALAVFLVSMAGIPTTAGFMGKFFLFAAAVKSQMYWLVVIGLVASAIGIYYYLRLIVLMFMRQAPPGDRIILIPVSARLVIVIMVAGTFLLGLFPGSLMVLASEVGIF